MIGTIVAVDGNVHVVAAQRQHLTLHFTHGDRIIHDQYLWPGRYLARRQGGDASQAPLPQQLLNRLQQVIDVENPTAPFEIASVDLRGMAYDVSIDGDRVFVGTLSGGLRVVNVLDRERPNEVGALGSIGRATEIARSGTTLFVAGTPSRVSVETSLGSETGCGSRNLASPKSRTLTTPLSVTITLRGLRSLCVMPRS